MQDPRRVAPVPTAARRLVLLGGLLPLLAGCGDDPATAPQAPPPAPAPNEPRLIELVALVDAHRATVGCEELTWHARVADVALAHSRDMVERGFFGHENPDGDGFTARLLAAGIRWDGAAAENIALEFGGAEAAFQAWLGSELPRFAIEFCAFTHHGAAVVDGRWTHLFVEDPF